MDETIEEIKRRADIVEVISQYVALRPAGPGKWKACCPFHDEKTPSFNVSSERGFYKCFGCSASGDVFKFVQEIENISFFEAKKQLAEKYGVAVQNKRDITPEQQVVYDERDRLLKINAATTAFFRAQFSGNKGLPARDYARTRGLSNATLERFGIGYAPDSWDALYHELINKYGFKPEECARAGVLVEKENEETQKTRYYDRYRHRWMFPIWDAQGRVIAFGGRVLEGAQSGASDAKYINSPEGPLFNKSRTLYGWHLARQEVGKVENVIICEGYMDAIALHEAGFTQTMATLGTSLTEQHVGMLARLSPKVVYLCYDGDSAGMRAALRSAPIFATHDLNVRVVTLPDNDDPDTFIRKRGQIGFQNALKNAPMLTRFRVEMAVRDFDMSQIGERMEAIKQASEVIAEVRNDIEKDALVTWLADYWAQSEGVTAATRVQMIGAAVRREVGAAVKRARAAQSSAKFPPQNHSQNGTSSTRRDDARAENLVENLPLSGVEKAERMLLATLLGTPSWRARILEKIPAGRWTRAEHAEIAESLRQFDWNEPIEAGLLMQTLSSESSEIVGELMLSDEAQIVVSDVVIDDLVARLNGNYARQVEHEILEMVRLKLERSEPISEAERKSYNDAIIATRRKSAPESKA